MQTAFLFDIDMTLIRTNGAGSRAMERAFRQRHGIADAFAGIEFAGRTDGSILRECYTRHGFDRLDLAEEFQRFRTVYLGLLEEALASEQRTEVLPGVLRLLALLQTRADVRLGLGTGNYRAAAEIKLRHAGLWNFFGDGGFADDSEDRADVLAAAVRRVAGDAAVRCWVVGDSEHDVRAAQANHLPVAGVATGHCSVDALAAAGADIVLTDLSDVDRFIGLTLG